MTRALPLLIGLAGLGLLAWLLLGGGEASDDPTALPGRIHEVPPDPGTITDGGLSGTRADPVERAPDRPAGPNAPREIRYGQLVVTPTDPEGGVLPADDITVHVRPAGLRWPAQPLGRRDRTTGRWRFERVPAGKVRVVVEGNTIRRGEQEVRVVADREAEATVVARPGGAIHYKVSLMNGGAPKQVTVTLKTERGSQLAAEYAVRTSRVITTPKKAQQFTNGPDGWILNLAPGNYRVRVESEGDHDELPVVVAPGAVVTLPVELRD